MGNVIWKASNRDVALSRDQCLRVVHTIRVGHGEHENVLAEKASMFALGHLSHKAPQSQSVHTWAWMTYVLLSFWILQLLFMHQCVSPKFLKEHGDSRWTRVWEVLKCVYHVQAIGGTQEGLVLHLGRALEKAFWSKKNLQPFGRKDELECIPGS